MAVWEVLFGKGEQHGNDSDKVRYAGQMLWNLANVGPSQYTTFIVAINADNNDETVDSVANSLRNYKSMINGLMQTRVSAMVKEFKEEFQEEMREEVKKIHVASV